jgi:hypothetical protein
MAPTKPAMHEVHEVGVEQDAQPEWQIAEKSSEMKNSVRNITYECYSWFLAIQLCKHTDRAKCILHPPYCIQPCKQLKIG